ncbi:hypothetical protein PHMEG_0007674, partial [Phytophthora megakarya]
MNGPGEKTFKQLWRELTKDGWKARKPKGLAKDHSYVKSGAWTPHSTAPITLLVHLLVARSARVSCVVLEDTEQGVALGDIPEDTEQVIRSIQEDTEYGAMVVGAIPESPELRCRVDYSGEDEAKSESDVHETDGTGVDFEVFDSDRFMEGLRAEKLFGRTAADDVNLVEEADTSDTDSDADNEDIMADNDTSHTADGVEDVTAMDTDDE